MHPPNHIKITTKLQNNHHSESPDNQLNGSPTTKDIKKKPVEMGKRDGDCQTGWSHIHVWWVKIRRDISAVEVASEEEGVPASDQVLQPRVPVPGMEVAVTSGYKTPAWLVAEEDRCLLESQAFLLQACTWAWTHSL